MSEEDYMKGPDDREEECGCCDFYINDDCRRNPPVFLSDARPAVWPEVEMTGWCGEFKPWRELKYSRIENVGLEGEA